MGYVDGALIRGGQAYEAEREAWLCGAAAARAEAINDILAEGARDTQRASKRLRYEVNRDHVGVIVWVESLPAEGDAQPALGEAIGNLARSLAAESTLIQSIGSLAAMGWLSRRGAFSATALDAVGAAGHTPLPPGVRAAIGEPEHGLKGFRRSHIEASHARRVGSLAGSRASRVTRYRDVAVAARGTADPEHALSFVMHVLGPLAADDEATYRVAMTLSVYLQENRSRTHAAKRLNVHPNTVSYRVQQAEAILGRSVDTDSVDLSVALALLPALVGLRQQRSTEL